MSYKLINRIKVPTGLLRDFIDFCCPRGLNDFSISFYPLKDKKLDYDCYCITEDNKCRIVIKVAKCKFPIISNPKSMAYLGYTERRYLRNLYEVLIMAISHETRHGFQNMVSKRDFNGGKVQKFSFYKGGSEFEANYRQEKDATIYGCRMLDKYRKLCKT
jgi:hypothetical protein